MLAVLSPAKRLDFDSPTPKLTTTQPQFLEDTKELLGVLRGKSKAQIAKLMDLSADLAALNYDRYQSMQFPFTKENARPALLAFKGDVYQSMEVAKYKEADFAFAQQHLRILSGLYGVLRPLDLIQPYRLEMGTGLKNPRGKDLYAFWGDGLSKSLGKEVAKDNFPVLINLASQEYFGAIQSKAFKGEIITVHFKEKKKGKLVVVGILAKKARGAMADYMIRKRITEPEGLKKFSGLGYRFQAKLSNDTDWVFSK